MTAPHASAALLLVLVTGCTATAASPPPAPAPGQAHGHAWRTAAEQAMSRLHAPVADTSCRQVLRTTVDGSRVRLRLSAAGLGAALPLTAVTVAVRTAGAAIASSTLRPVTLRGSSAFSVPAGGRVTTDPVDLPVRAGDDVAVTFAVHGRTWLPEHAVGGATGWCAPDGSGDLTSQAIAGGLLTAGRGGLVVDALEVAAPQGAPLGVLAVGDSLTDPPADPDRYRRWTDRLAARLPGTAVANAAIGGNRVQLPGGYGPALSARFATDALALPGVGTLVVFAGTNDVSGGLAAAALEQRLAQLCGRARAAGLRVVLTTLPPAQRRPPALEAVRLQVNRWIRATTAADAVLDADALLRDPTHPRRLRPVFDHGDGLHLSDGAHRVLGDAAARLLARTRPGAAAS